MLLGIFTHEIESMTENYPELQVANLNYAGGHAGHQIKFFVVQATIYHSRQNWALLYISLLRKIKWSYLSYNYKFILQVWM